MDLRWSPVAINGWSFYDSICSVIWRIFLRHSPILMTQGRSRGWKSGLTSFNVPLRPLNSGLNKSSIRLNGKNGGRDEKVSDWRQSCVRASERVSVFNSCRWARPDSVPTPSNGFLLRLVSSLFIPRMWGPCTTWSPKTMVRMTSHHKSQWLNG